MRRQCQWLIGGGAAVGCSPDSDEGCLKAFEPVAYLVGGGGGGGLMFLSYLKILVTLEQLGK